eukprot:INCI3685.2.p1 GENE.INCI3685.2~~INCI3685.2.p1  ORF type:complete len:246 (+),score=29.44 INCI3685.2:475-1212(+)
MDKFDAFVAKFVEALPFRDSFALFKKLRKHATNGNCTCPHAVRIRRFTDIVILPVAVPQPGESEYVHSDGLVFANTTIKFLRKLGRCVVPLPLFLDSACMRQDCSDGTCRDERPQQKPDSTKLQDKRDGASASSGSQHTFALCQVRCFLSNLEREKQLPVSIHIVGHRSGPAISVGKGHALKALPFEVGRRLAAVCPAPGGGFVAPKIRVFFHVCNSAGRILRLARAKVTCELEGATRTPIALPF